MKNFVINKDFYTDDELLIMARERNIFCTDEVFDIRYITNVQQLKIVVSEYLQICVKKLKWSIIRLLAIMKQLLSQIMIS